MKETIAQLLEGKDLKRAQAYEAMKKIMAGEATPSQIAGFLIALRAKGETPEEIAGWDTSTPQGNGGGGSGGGGSGGNGGGGSGGNGGGGGGGQLKTVTLRNFVGLFVDCRGTIDAFGVCQPGGGQNEIHVRFIEYTGVKALPPSQNTGSLVKLLQLVE